jgi:hypothetical protein
MLDDPSLRMLATCVAAIGLGTWTRRRAKVRLQEWENNPVAAQQRALKVHRLNASGVSYVGAVIICFGLVLFVEVVVTALRGVV